MFTNSEGRLQPVWGFAISAVFTFAAFFIAGVVAEALSGQRYLVLEVCFRTLLAVLLLALYVWLLTVADGVHRGRIAALGLPRARGYLKQFFFGCALGLVLTVLGVLPLLLAGHPKFALRTGVHLLPQIAGVLLVLMVGALAEELIFRGYPFQHLVAGIGAPAAIAVFSILFGVVHLSNPGASFWGLVNTILIGILLSIAYLRTRALWLPWGIHFGWNLTLGFLLGLPVSGLTMFSVMVRTTTTGPRWMTGGAYGIEASAAGAAAILVGLVAICRMPLPALTPPAGPALEPAHEQGLTGI